MGRVKHFLYWPFREFAYAKLNNILESIDIWYLVEADESPSVRETAGYQIQLMKLAAAELYLALYKAFGGTHV